MNTSDNRQVQQSYTHAITIQNNAHLDVDLYTVLDLANANEASGLDNDSFFSTLLVTTGITVKAGLITDVFLRYSQYSR